MPLPAPAMTTEPGFEQRVRDSFGRQPAMTLIGAQLVRVVPGEVEVVLPYRREITQQHGFVHAGMIGAALDSACGYAALTVMPAGTGILTIEYKLNCLAPGVLEVGVSANLPPARLEEFLRHCALGRVGTFQEAAEVAAFMVSDRNSYMNGATVVLDGAV